jgi:hypothetical protein
MNAALFRRNTTSICLALAAILSVLWVALQPPMDGDPLVAISAAGASADISAFAFVVSQLPFIIAALGIAHLIRDRAPILSAIGGTLGVLGGFGHAVFGGVQLTQLAMAADSANHEVYAGLLSGGLPLPLMIMMMCGTAGTVLGIVILGIGLLRAKVGPVWVPYALWGFVLVEFVGTNFTAWASLVSGLLYLASFCALAVTAWRSPILGWMTGTAALARESVPVA